MKIEIDPSDLYKRYLADKHGTVAMFGYTGDQIIEALEFWERNKTQVSMSFANELLDKYGLTLDDLSKAADRKFYSGRQWSSEEIRLMKEKAKGINKMQEMTKAEAETKLFQRDIASERYYVLDVLEALGLIKFKEQPESISRAKFKHQLRRLGYSELSKNYEDSLDSFDKAMI